MSAKQVALLAYNHQFRFLYVSSAQVPKASLNRSEEAVIVKLATWRQARLRLGLRQSPVLYME
jgi:hypothetical protein